jgi:DNA helicase II / ATP-dependent DNA helicase PcrA
LTFPVLLHPDLYQRLRRSDRSVQTRLRKTLLRLREGHWGGGTRVKRLKGVGHPVYEARTDSGDRLLFTMTRAALAAEPERLVPHLQVWDLVQHDDAERTARRNRTPEAEFLELETLEQFDIDEPPPHPEAGFAEIPATGADEADPLLRFLLPPDGFVSAAPEGITGGVRWFHLDPASLADESEFQRLLDAGGEELELKLTREQYAVLQAPGPVLLAGSAGSGKTSVAAHRLASAVTAPGSLSALYLSYSPSLVDRARVLVRDLVLARGGDPDRNPPDFYTFGDLYRSLVPRDFREHQARPITEAMFREWFKRSGRSLDPALVWEELRSILKGACLSLSQPMLDEAAYFELGRKRAPLFVAERPEIYRIAQRYQEWLAEEGRSDRIDLCRWAFAELRHKKRRWDVVVCDEVQDLTELEVAFVLTLSSRPDLAGVLLTGDTQQIVNPSGFRWAEVRRLAAKAAHLRSAPPVLRLRRNLRSVRPVVELGNALLGLRREVFGRTEEDDFEDAVLEGPVPLEIPAGEEAALAAIAGFGPRAAVLTLDDAETERIRRRLGTTRAFHVREAKGLEFETVVLWKVLSSDRDLVDRFVRGDARLEREPRFSRLLQHLYVAVTRSRRHLVIYEGNGPDPLWGQERFRGRLERGTVEDLARLFRSTASPEEWAREGAYYFERGCFRQAAECFRRAGLAERESEALACAAEELEDWSGALELWRSLGNEARQAPLLERLGRLEEAAVLYRRQGLDAQARRCDLLLLERGKAWAEAARGWEELGQHADAARCWARAGADARSAAANARAAEEKGNWSRAGASWAEIEAWEEAARAFRKAGDARQTAHALARFHESREEWSRAAAAWRLAGEPEKAARGRARALESTGRRERAARLWEKLGEKDRAADLYAEEALWMEVARLEGGSPEIRERLLLKIREMAESGACEEALPLIRARLEVLQPKLPPVPWFVFVESDRLVWQEFSTLQRLERRCFALRAEAEEAWSRATRLWEAIGETQRASETRSKRIEALSDPARREKARRAVEQRERAYRELRAMDGPDAGS